MTTSTHGPATSAPTRLASLDSVLLGVLAIASCLPFVADDQSPLWSAPPTGHAAATKLAVIVLCAVLLWGAVAAGGLAQGVAQLAGGVLAALAVLVGDELGAGGTLLALTAVLAAVTGLVSVVLGRLGRP